MPDTIAPTVRWRELFPTHGALALAIFVCAVAPATLTWIEIVKNSKYSPVDETAHFDYVERVARGELPRQGQHLLDSTLRDLACRKTAVFEQLRTPPCGAKTIVYSQFSSTYQHEAQQPPLYYAVTVALRWGTQHIARIDDKVRATRAANILWLIAGLLLLWAAGRLMAIRPLLLASGLLLLVCAPNVVYHTATVTNDASGIPACGLVAFVAALTYRRGGRRAALALFAAGFVAAALKVSNLFAVVPVSALFAVAAISARAAAEPWRQTAGRWMRDGGALLAGGIVASGTWAVIHRSRSLIDFKDDPTFEVLRGAPRTFDLVIREAVTLLQPLGTGSLAPTLTHTVQIPFYWALAFLIMAAGLSGLFVTPRRWPHALGLIAVPALYVGGLVFGLGLMLNYDIDPGLSGRYGVSLAPLLILVLVATVDGKWAQRALTAFAGTFFGVMLVAMLS
jgi:hypothetical protein